MESRGFPISRRWDDEEDPRKETEKERPGKEEANPGGFLCLLPTAERASHGEGSDRVSPTPRGQGRREVRMMTGPGNVLTG